MTEKLAIQDVTEGFDFLADLQQPSYQRVSNGSTSQKARSVQGSIRASIDGASCYQDSTRDIKPFAFNNILSSLGKEFNVPVYLRSPPKDKAPRQELIESKCDLELFIGPKDSPSSVIDSAPIEPPTVPSPTVGVPPRPTEEPIVKSPAMVLPQDPPVAENKVADMVDFSTLINQPDVSDSRQNLVSRPNEIQNIPVLLTSTKKAKPLAPLHTPLITSDGQVVEQTNQARIGNQNTGNGPHQFLKPSPVTLPKKVGVKPHSAQGYKAQNISEIQKLRQSMLARRINFVPKKEVVITFRPTIPKGRPPVTITQTKVVNESSTAIGSNSTQANPAVGPTRLENNPGTVVPVTVPQAVPRLKNRIQVLVKTIHQINSEADQPETVQQDKSSTPPKWYRVSNANAIDTKSEEPPKPTPSVNQQPKVDDTPKPCAPIQSVAQIRTQQKTTPDTEVNPPRRVHVVSQRSTPNSESAAQIRTQQKTTPDTEVNPPRRVHVVSQRSTPNSDGLSGVQALLKSLAEPKKSVPMPGQKKLMLIKPRVHPSMILAQKIISGNKSPISKSTVENGGPARASNNSPAFMRLLDGRIQKVRVVTSSKLENKSTVVRTVMLNGVRREVRIAVPSKSGEVGSSAELPTVSSVDKSPKISAIAPIKKIRNPSPSPSEPATKKDVPEPMEINDDSGSDTYSWSMLDTPEVTNVKSNDVPPDTDFKWLRQGVKYQPKILQRFQPILKMWGQRKPDGIRRTGRAHQYDRRGNVTNIHLIHDTVGVLRMTTLRQRHLAEEPKSEEELKSTEASSAAEPKPKRQASVARRGVASTSTPTTGSDSDDSEYEYQSERPCPKSKKTTKNKKKKRKDCVKTATMYEKDKSFKGKIHHSDVMTTKRETRQSRGMDKGEELKRLAEQCEAVVVLKRMTNMQLRQFRVRGYKSSPRRALKSNDNAENTSDR